MANNNMINKTHLQEILKCDLCNQYYDSEIHIPMVAKCGHTFCKNCLQQKRHKENYSLNCPIDNISNALNFETSIRNIKIEDILIKILNCEINQKVYTKPDIRRKSVKEKNNKNVNHTRHRSNIELSKNFDLNINQSSIEKPKLNTSLDNETIETIQMNDDKSTVNNSFLTELNEFFAAHKNLKIEKETNNNPNLIRSINIHFNNKLNNIKTKILNDCEFLSNTNSSNKKKNKNATLEREEIKINRNLKYLKDKTKTISRNKIPYKINSTNMLYNNSSVLSPLNFNNNKTIPKKFMKKKNVFIYDTLNEIKTPNRKTYQCSTCSNVKKSFSINGNDKNNENCTSPYEKNKLIYNKKINISKNFSSDKNGQNLDKICKTRNFIYRNNNFSASHSKENNNTSYNVTLNNSREKNNNENYFNENRNTKLKTLFIASRNAPKIFIKNNNNKTNNTNENKHTINDNYSAKSYRVYKNNNVNLLNKNDYTKYSTGTIKNNKILRQKQKSQERDYKTFNSVINVRYSKKNKEINENNSLIEKIMIKLQNDFQLIMKNKEYTKHKTKYEKLFENIIENNNKNSFLSKLIIENSTKLLDNINSIKVTFLNNTLNLFIGIFDNENDFPIKGILFQENYSKYEGEFKNGKKNGKGKIMYENGWIYEGEFSNDNQSGFGRLIQNDNEKYEGEWKNGKMNGEGMRIHNNGDKYIGNYINNVRNGFGKYYFSNGDYYEGNWENGKENGDGVLYFNNGEKYEGEFKNNLIYGKGRFYKKNGDIYEGEFIDGLINGKGTITKKNGDKFYGNFIKGQKNGNGKLVDKNGKIIKIGYWKQEG